jgi:pimeloyl-ACP methyl ester carboxylesterase
VDCGYLSVPEKRSAPDARFIRLHVAIFRAPTPQAGAEPLLYLEGGPGGSAIKQMEDAFERFFSPFNTTRDFIVLDQRGTGYSKPSILCEELTALEFEQLDEVNLPLAQELEAQLAAVAACRERFAAQGVDLSAYNSAENAADVEDLRRALGIEKWTLYGISYGTRLALTVMRDYPEGVRSVILDSAYPPEADLYATFAPHYVRALGTLFTACAEDADCASAYPDLERVFYATIARLDKNPINIQASLRESGENYIVSINGRRLAQLVFKSLYQTNIIPYLPQIIMDASRDRFGLFGVLYMAYFESGLDFSDGMNFSVQCGEEVAFSDPALTTASIAQYPALASFLVRTPEGGDEIYPLCATWGVEAADPRENLPVTSDIPTLVMAGEYDPITPPAWGEQVAAHLPRSYFYTYAGLGHGVTTDGGCPLEMALAFLENPDQAPDSTCLNEMAAPTFIIVKEEPVLSFEPFESTLFGLEGIYPTGWRQLTEGTYARSAIGEVALSHLGLRGVDGRRALALVLEQIGLEAPPPNVSIVKSPVLTWEVYRFPALGYFLSLGVADSGEAAYLILLQSPPSEADSLHEAVFLPALQALRPLD